jgi:hypothetical protein
LEWCSAAEGGRWQTIMTEIEKKRAGVTAQEVEKSREILAQARVPSPRNPRARDLDQPADFVCLRCGYSWAGVFKIEERICPQCRSNSIRWVRR